MANIDIWSEVKATGVFSGFDASATGATLHVGPGHARLNGVLLPGGWNVDLSNNAPGWWVAVVSPGEVNITQDIGAPGLPLHLVYIGADGRLSVGRDLRRRCVGVIWEAGCNCIVSLPFTEPFAFRRLQAASGEVDGAGVPYWSECVVEASLPNGRVICPGEFFEVSPLRVTGGKIGMIMEGYDIGNV